MFYIYLNSFPFLKLGYGAALSLMLAAFILVFTVTQIGDCSTAEPPDDATRAARRYLVGAVCVAICTFMVLPIVASVLASVKPTAEAAETPPTYFPHGFSLERLPTTVGVPGRAADLRHQQLRRGRC